MGTTKGTSLYRSLNAHERKRCTVFDDFNSWLYVAMYIMIDGLPWKRECAKLKNKPKQKRKVAEEGKRKLHEWLFNAQNQENDFPKIAQALITELDCNKAISILHQMIMKSALTLNTQQLSCKISIIIHNDRSLCIIVNV